MPNVLYENLGESRSPGLLHDLRSHGRFDFAEANINVTEVLLQGG